MKILSRRSYKCRPAWDLVYEWEDQLSLSLGMKIKRRSRLGFWLCKQLASIGLTLPAREPDFMFQMRAMGPERGRYNSSTVACVIDYFVPERLTDEYLKTLEVAPLTLFTSREAYEHVAARLAESAGERVRIGHLPISLPDKYMPTEGQAFEKDIDVLIIGRLSPVLKGFLDRYVADHPSLVVAERRQADRHAAFYTSDGRCIGFGNTRREYIDLLRRSRVIPYCTPGCDGEKATEGFSQVTPRFLELLAAGCQPLLRYRRNADSRWFGLEEFCPSIESYEDFVRELEKALSRPADMERNRRYLAKHLTSQRAAQLKQLLEDER